MSKVKATRRAAPAPYFQIRGRRVRIDQIVLVIPQAEGGPIRLIVDKAKIRYDAENWASTTYEHETLTASLG